MSLEDNGTEQRSAFAAAAAAGVPEISDLDKLLAQMTMRITDTAAAAELQEMALAAIVARAAKRWPKNLGCLG